MKKKYIVLLCLSLLCLAVCLFLDFQYQRTLMDDGEVLEALRDSIKEFETVSTDTEPPETVSPVIPDDTTEVPPPESDTEIPADSVPPVTDPPPATDTVPVTTAPVPVNPGQPTLNFNRLWRINPEIYAWIDIAGTRIDYPVMQSPDDDKKYLNVAYDGSRYLGGAIYSEATYNGTYFNDPVTVLYGHTMRSGMQFGQLQKIYSSAATFEQHRDITIYLPGDVRHYTVFAAVPYANLHILHTYDFTNDYWYNRFFRDVKRIRAIGANIDESCFPEAGDRVIILSVCLNEDTTRRFLVMAVLEEDLADNAAFLES